MAEKHITRIDKWLWAVRIFNSRAMATAACVGGKVKIDGTTVKASRNIQKSDIIQVRMGVMKYLYKIRQIAIKRMSAILVENFMQDLTHGEELAKLKSSQKQSIQTREKGQGRLTKRERRNMDKFREKF